MRVLRLTNSDDLNPRIPEGQHSWEICERELSRATGEPVETLCKVTWPDDSLPDLLEKWIKRDEPDLVILLVTSFWFTYESVPLKLQRRMPVIGRAAAAAGIKAAGTPWLSENPIFRGGRELALRTIGGETYFTPEYIAALLERCVRVVLQHEHVGLVVRGPMTANGAGGGPKGRTRAQALWARTDAPLEALCRQLSVPYVNRAAVGFGAYESESLLGDGLHGDATTHRNRGMAEARALAEAWRQVRA